MESRSTEFRHRQGQATLRVRSQTSPTSRNPFNIISSSPVKRVLAKFRTSTKDPMVGNRSSASSIATRIRDTLLNDNDTAGPLPMDLDVVVDAAHAEDFFAAPPVVQEEHNGQTPNDEEGPQIVAHTIAGIQQETWANRTRRGTAFVEDYESDEEDEGLPGLYTVDDEDEDEDAAQTEDEEEEEELDGGLPASDMVDKEWECELAQYGTYM